jgi:hypothetical protein
VRWFPIDEQKPEHERGLVLLPVQLAHLPRSTATIASIAERSSTSRCASQVPRRRSDRGPGAGVMVGCDHRLCRPPGTECIRAPFLNGALLDRG